MLDIARSIENKNAGDAMTSPVVTVEPDDSARAAAEEMLRLHVSGLPVVDRDGRPLGVVSESDFRFSDVMTRQRQREAWVAILAGGQDIAAEYLDALERAGESVRQVMSRPALSVDQQAPLFEVADLMTAHRVKRVLARETAVRGEAGVTALVFPAALCNDGGRMINLPDPEWPRSLCGKAADFYLRWDKELRPLGFGLSARIATFPDGFPGDAELSLVWGR